MAGLQEETIYQMQRHAMLEAIGEDAWHKCVNSALTASTLMLESRSDWAQKMARLERQIVQDWASTQPAWQ